MGNPKTVTAYYTLQFYLYVGIKPSTALPLPTPPSGWQDAGTTVTLEAAEVAWVNSTAVDRMYSFYRWFINGARDGHSKVDVLMDGPKHCVADYVRGAIDPVGDVNWDGHIDIRDLAAIAVYFGCTPRSAMWSGDCDVNNDGIIDILDLSAAAKNFGYSQLQ
jgi:hypothetical protein